MKNKEKIRFSPLRVDKKGYRVADKHYFLYDGISERIQSIKRIASWYAYYPLSFVYIIICAIVIIDNIYLYAIPFTLLPGLLITFIIEYILIRKQVRLDYSIKQEKGDLDTDEQKKPVSDGITFDNSICENGYYIYKYNSDLYGHRGAIKIKVEF